MILSKTLNKKPQSWYDLDDEIFTLVPHITPINNVISQIELD